MISSAEINHVFFLKQKRSTMSAVVCSLQMHTTHSALFCGLPACFNLYGVCYSLSLSSSAADRVTLYMALVTASSARSYISPSDESTMLVVGRRCFLLVHLWLHHFLSPSSSDNDDHRLVLVLVLVLVLNDWLLRRKPLRAHFPQYNIIIIKPHPHSICYFSF